MMPGIILSGEVVKRHVQRRPLPPNPPLQINGLLRDQLDKALLALGRLSGSCLQVHDALKHRPVNTIAGLSRITSLSPIALI